MMFNVVIIILESMVTKKYIGCIHDGVLLLGDTERLLINNGCELTKWEKVLALGVGESIQLTHVNRINDCVYNFFITKIN